MQANERSVFVYLPFSKVHPSHKMYFKCLFYGVMCVSVAVCFQPKRTDKVSIVFSIFEFSLEQKKKKEIILCLL